MLHRHLKRCALAVHLRPVPGYARVRFKVTRHEPWQEAVLCLLHCSALRHRVATGEIWRGEIVRVLDSRMLKRHQKLKPFPRPVSVERVGDASRGD